MYIAPASLVTDGEESARNAGDLGSILEWERVPGEEHGYPVFLPGESHGQRSLVGNSPWGRKELGTTEHLVLSYDSKSQQTL